MAGSALSLLLNEITAEMALFAATGFLLFAIDDVIVDVIYFALRGWRGLGARGLLDGFSPRTIALRDGGQHTRVNRGAGCG